MERSAPIVMSNYGDAVFVQEDLDFCEAVQARMNKLYKIDGRDNRDHPQHGIYTGLSKKYRFPSSSN